MREAVWGGSQPQLGQNDIILTPQVTQNLNNWAKKCGYDCVRLLPYAYEQHINLFKHFVFILYGWAKQFEVAVSLK